MRQEEIFEILSKIHGSPASWLSNLFHFSGQQLSMFACGCEVLLLHGVTPEQVRWTIEQNKQVVVFLADGSYDKALWIARVLESEALGDSVQTSQFIAHKLPS
jgi:hypothetical protein